MRYVPFSAIWATWAISTQWLISLLVGSTHYIFFVRCAILTQISAIPYVIAGDRVFSHCICCDSCIIPCLRRIESQCCSKRIAIGLWSVHIMTRMFLSRSWLLSCHFLLRVPKLCIAYISVIGCPKLPATEPNPRYHGPHRSHSKRPSREMQHDLIFRTESSSLEALLVRHALPFASACRLLDHSSCRPCLLSLIDWAVADAWNRPWHENWLFSAESSVIHIWFALVQRASWCLPKMLSVSPRETEPPFVGFSMAFSNLFAPCAASMLRAAAQLFLSRPTGAFKCTNEDLSLNLWQQTT